MNVFVKLLGTSIPAGEIAFARGLFGTVAVLIIMYMNIYIVAKKVILTKIK